MDDFLKDFLNETEKLIASWLKADLKVSTKSVKEKLRDLAGYRNMELPAIGVKAISFEEDKQGTKVNGVCEVIAIGDYVNADELCSKIMSEVYISLNSQIPEGVEADDFFNNVKATQGSTFEMSNKNEFVFAGHINFEVLLGRVI